MGGTGPKAERLPRLASGIEALDRALSGGIPIGNSVLLAGSCGTGKTTLAAEFLLAGARAKEPSLLLAVTEDAERLLENLRTYEFFDQALVGPGKFELLDVAELYKGSPLEKTTVLGAADVPVLVKLLLDQVDKRKTRRLVIDSLTGLCLRFPSKELVRDFVSTLSKGLSKRGVTCLLISELEAGSTGHSSHGVEDAVVDGVLQLGNTVSRGHLLRTLQIVKMRGTPHSRTRYVLELSHYGAILVPLLRSGKA